MGDGSSARLGHTEVLYGTKCILSCLVVWRTCSILEHGQQFKAFKDQMMAVLGASRQMRKNGNGTRMGWGCVLP